MDLIISITDKTFEIAKMCSKKFANGFVYWSFGFFIYHIYSAEGLEKILTNPKHNEKSFTYKFLHNLLGTGLLTSDGEKWFSRRKLLTPAFHFNVLNEFQRTFKYFLIINFLNRILIIIFFYLSENTALLISTIREMEVDRPEGTHLQQLISRFTLNIICGRFRVDILFDQ